MVNAGYLIRYGLSDDHSHQWHASDDYFELTRGFDTKFHPAQYYRFGDRMTANPTTLATKFRQNWYIDYYCGAFDKTSAWSTPAGRVSVMVHESWHSWQKDNRLPSAHQKCGANDCDPYYFHPVGAYEFGKLNEFATDKSLFHSPYPNGRRGTG